jgi:hypothetical protein
VEISHPETGETWSTKVPNSEGIGPGSYIKVAFPTKYSSAYAKKQGAFIATMVPETIPVTVTHEGVESVEGLNPAYEQDKATTFDVKGGPDPAGKAAYYHYEWYPWVNFLPATPFECIDDVRAGLDDFIPPSYLENLENLILFGKPVLLVGTAGIGKTVGVHWLAKKNEKQIFRVNFDGGMTPESFIGAIRVKTESITLSDGTTDIRSVTFFQNGPVVNAAEQGGWLLLDELDKAQPEYAAALHAMLESVRNPIVLNDDGGRVVTPHPDFRIIATANTLGDVEDSSLGFFGSSPMNAAFKDRFSIFRVSYPEEEFEILMKVFPCKDLVTKTLKVAQHVRDSGNSGFSGKLGVALSPRRLVAFLTTFRLFCVKNTIISEQKHFPNYFLNAIQYEITSRLPSEDSNLVMQFFNDVFGSKSLATSPDLYSGDLKAETDSKPEHVNPSLWFKTSRTAASSGAKRGTIDLSLLEGTGPVEIPDFKEALSTELASIGSKVRDDIDRADAKLHGESVEESSYKHDLAVKTASDILDDGSLLLVSDSGESDEVNVDL